MSSSKLVVDDLYMANYSYLLQESVMICAVKCENANVNGAVNTNKREIVKKRNGTL